MAVISFRRKPNPRSTNLSDAGIWEARETWIAITDTETTNPLFFVGDPLLPALDSVHPNNALLRFKGIASAQAIDKALKAWEFILIWRTMGFAGPGTDNHDPDRYDDSLRATKSWSHRIITEPVEKAYVSDDGGATFSGSQGPVQSTTFDLFVPGLTRNRSLPVCHYVRNELVVPASVLDTPDLVNNDAFTLDGKAVAIGEAMILAAPVSERKRFEAVTYRTVSYDIILRPEGWDDEILNRSFFSFQQGGVRARALIENGVGDDALERPWVESPEPVVLNSASQHLAWYLANVDDDPDTFMPHYRKFRHLTRTSFTALGFT